MIAVNAASLASLKKADLPGEPHLVERIFHFFLPPGVTPNLVVDITPYFEQWIKALSAHESQFLNPEKTKDYIESISVMSRWVAYSLLWVLLNIETHPLWAGYQLSVYGRHALTASTVHSEDATGGAHSTTHERIAIVIRRDEVLLD